MSDPGFLRWLDGDSHDVGILGWMDGDSHDTGFTPEAGFVPTPGGLLDGPPPDTGSSFHWLLGPADAATIEGLQDHQAPVTNDQSGMERVALGGQTADGPTAPPPKNPIGPVKGYPETGKDAWRAGNDDVIVAAANKYNSERHLFPGDAEYVTPELMKAWQMRESGGSPDAFKTDPFQVNNARDWPKTGEKARIAGLSQGQKMTPETSAEAALKWFHYKGRIDEKTGKLTPYQGHYEGLRKYNAAPSAPGIPNGADYANAVMNNAWASYGDWQE